jgi:hypothetical protein
VLVAIHSIAQWVRDLLVRGVILFVGNTDESYQCTKFSIPELVQQQAAWMFCIHLRVDFTALHPEHHLLQIVVSYSAFPQGKKPFFLRVL